MSSCADPVTGELSEDACDLCRGVRMTPAEKRTREDIRIFQAERKRQRLLKKRKLERSNKTKARRS